MIDRLTGELGRTLSTIHIKLSGRRRALIPLGILAVTAIIYATTGYSFLLGWVIGIVLLFILTPRGPRSRIFDR